MAGDRWRQCSVVWLADPKENQAILLVDKVGSVIGVQKREFCEGAFSLDAFKILKYCHQSEK